MLGHDEHPASGEPVPPPGRMPCVPRPRKVLSLAARHSAWATTTSAPSICYSRSSARARGVADKILERFGALDEAARVQTLGLLEQRDADGHK